jgi:hypothetical protein
VPEQLLARKSLLYLPSWGVLPVTSVLGIPESPSELGQVIETAIQDERACGKVLNLFSDLP